MPTGDQIIEILAPIKAALDKRFGEGARAIRILWGGSVTAENVAAILDTPHVDGVLVGGPSLSPADFKAIVAVARARAIAPSA
jgi:triosephosphate isomerase